MAGTPLDLDADLEAASIEHLLIIELSGGLLAWQRAKLTKRLGTLPLESFVKLKKG